MAHAYLTSADVAHFNKTDLDMVVRDILNAAPMLQVCPARTCKSNVFYYTRATTAPVVGFREVNDGLENTKATREKVTVALDVLDASFAVDIAAAQVDERGWQHLLAEEGYEHLTQAMFEVEKQVINGTNNNAVGFPGFADSVSLDRTADEMVISAGGTVGGAASSVYIVCGGPGEVEILWGQEGVINIGDMQIVERAGSSTGLFPAYYHPITGWVGLKIGSIRSVARICNIGTTSATTLDDDMLSEALSLFPVGKVPSFMVMSRRSRKQLQQSRTAYNPSGQPVQVPNEAFGVPIIASDAVLNTEQLVS